VSQHRVLFTVQLDAQGNVWGVDRGDPNRYANKVGISMVHGPSWRPQGATGFGVLYLDKDKITTLRGYPLNGPPGYAFKVAPSARGSR